MSGSAPRKSEKGRTAVGNAARKARKRAGEKWEPKPPKVKGFVKSNPDRWDRINASLKAAFEARRAR